MAKREDWEYILKLRRKYNINCEHFCKTPLLVIENSQLLINSREFLSQNIFDEHFNDFDSNSFPVNNFSVLNKTHLNREWSIATGFDQYDYYQVSLSPNAIFIYYFTTNEGIISACASRHYPFFVSDNDDKVLSDLDDNHIFMKGLMNNLTSFLQALSESDLHPVEKRGTQNRHRPHIKHDKKPWQRGDLASIVFLNKLPTKSQPSEAKGGHHASPRYHQRRGHTRIMRSDRYKDNPNFGKPMYIKPMWVGKRESVVNGTTYKVI